MAKTNAERQAAYRKRMFIEGSKITMVLPRETAAQFRVLCEYANKNQVDFFTQMVNEKTMEYIKKKAGVTT
jgi:hypothetical protein